jgi:uncharacterized coiled-coil DUF342 family protein
MSTHDSLEDVEQFHTPARAGISTDRPVAPLPDRSAWDVELPDKNLNMQRTRLAILELRAKVDTGCSESSKLRHKLDEICAKFDSGFVEVCEHSRQAIQDIQNHGREMVKLCSEDLSERAERLLSDSDTALSKPFQALESKVAGVMSQEELAAEQDALRSKVL